MLLVAFRGLVLRRPAPAKMQQQESHGGHCPRLCERLGCLSYSRRLNRACRETQLARIAACAPRLILLTSLLAGGLWAWFAYMLVANAAPADMSPNIIIFQPDDMPFYWEEAPPVPSNAPKGTRDPTPHLDRVRAESVVFTRAYAASSACSASRFAVLTGRYPSRSKVARQKTRECSFASTLTEVEVALTKLVTHCL